ncbi:hypothetical protein RBI14_17000 [Alcaligenaceae bacterium B3P038]|nr:hypothetical protein [Alcaligenaceae bacterium B3P038]
MKGDYQAQRNRAYGYVDFAYEGQDKNPMLGCAWYIVILYSGDQRVNQRDVGNVKVYCGKLDKLEQNAAIGQARRLYKTIYNDTPAF